MSWPIRPTWAETLAWYRRMMRRALRREARTAFSLAAARAMCPDRRRFPKAREALFVTDIDTQLGAKL